MKTLKNRSRKTKIVATIGPASWSPEILKEALLAGLNVARFNFSHGTIERHTETFQNLRAVSKECGASVAILQDLQGPKIRLAHFKNPRDVQEGDQLDLHAPGVDPETHTVVEFPPLFAALTKGDSLFIDDGIIELKVLSVEPKKAQCQVISGGTLRSRKGLNLPNTPLEIDCLTAKDLKDLKAGAPLGFDFVALSFVRRVDDIIQLRKHLKEAGSKAQVIAKIEKQEAMDNIEAIVHESDAVMIARGDLAVEIGQVHLPAAQKKITRLCNQAGKPVITATQMLDSMQNNSRPTRAEISDVANAVLDGSDALMLSGESAFGKYPVLSIKTMCEIVVEVEKQKDIYYQFKNRMKKGGAGVVGTVPESIAMSAVLCAKEVEAKVIVCMSTTGKTARLISKFRPKAQLVALTVTEQSLNTIELCWGVKTFTVPRFRNSDEAIQFVEDILLSEKLAQSGEKVVLTLGLPVMEKKKTNSLRVFNLP